jgi:hypothetical protein
MPVVAQSIVNSWHLIEPCSQEPITGPYPESDESITEQLNCIYFADLNFGTLATGFGLLKLPKMPELQGKDVSDFEEVDIDFNSIPYM